VTREAGLNVVREAVIFVGIQASGKSTFYQERFFHTHIRINLDMLRTRNREARFLQTCLEAKQSFVVDNTNPTQADRGRYIGLAKDAGFRMVGYLFRSTVDDALRRNMARTGKQCIPAIAIHACHARLEAPSEDEGFDELFEVEIVENRFEVKPLANASH
jgi:predicted kinase